MFQPYLNSDYQILNRIYVSSMLLPVMVVPRIRAQLQDRQVELKQVYSVQRAKQSLYQVVSPNRQAKPTQKAEGRRQA